MRTAQAAPRLAQVPLGQVQVGEVEVGGRAQHQRAHVRWLALQQRAPVTAAAPGRGGAPQAESQLMGAQALPPADN